MNDQKKTISQTYIGEPVGKVQKAVRAYISYHKEWGRKNPFRGYLLHVDPIDIEDSGEPGIKFIKYVLMSGKVFKVEEAKRFSAKTLNSFNELTPVHIGEIKTTVGEVVKGFIESLEIKT